MYAEKGVGKFRFPISGQLSRSVAPLRLPVWQLAGAPTHAHAPVPAATARRGSSLPSRSPHAFPVCGEQVSHRRELPGSCYAAARFKRSPFRNRSRSLVALSKSCSKIGLRRCALEFLLGSGSGPAGSSEWCCFLRNVFPEKSTSYFFSRNLISFRGWMGLFLFSRMIENRAGMDNGRSPVSVSRGKHRSVPLNSSKSIRRDSLLKLCVKIFKKETVL